MKGFAGNVIRQVLAEDAGATRDASTLTAATAPSRDGATGSGGRYHAAVLAASSRTTHELKAGDSPRDPRYASDDPAVDALWRALCEVADPELPISLVDLGLICEIRRDDGAVDIDLTFTASACPCMEFIVEDVRGRLLQVPGVESVAVRDVWDPPWTTDRMTEHGRALLRSFGVAA